MWDRVSTEQLSAYLDGELPGDERKHVERQLAKFEECRQALAELEAVRADIQSLPSFAAPLDIRARVLAQIEGSVPADDVPTSEVIAAKPTRTWKSLAVMAVSLAAVVGLFLLLPGPQPPIPGPTARPVPVHLRKAPPIALVYDVILTEVGYERKSFEKLLQRLGIGLDPTMKLSPRIAYDLTALRGSDTTRLEPFRAGEEIPRDGAQEDVELVYVSGTHFELEQLGRALYSMLNSQEHGGEEVAGLRATLVYEERQLEVMRELHQSARDHFASTTTSGPAELAYAFKLNFDLRFASFGVPGAASFAAPAISVTAKEPATASSEAAVSQETSDQARPTGANSRKEEPLGPGVDLETTGQILFFVRRAPAEAK